MPQLPLSPYLRKLVISGWLLMSRSGALAGGWRAAGWEGGAAAGGGENAAGAAGAAAWVCLMKLLCMVKCSGGLVQGVVGCWSVSEQVWLRVLPGRHTCSVSTSG